MEKKESKFLGPSDRVCPCKGSPPEGGCNKDWDIVQSQCGINADYLEIKARANTWCHILKYKDINLGALCELRITLPCYFPWDDIYNTLRLEYNKVINQFPSVIVMAEKVEDIQEAIKWAHEHRMQVSIRSGTHSFEGFSVCDGMVIDVSRMNRIKVHKKHETVEIEAGALIGPTYLKLQEYGFVLPAEHALMLVLQD